MAGYLIANIDVKDAAKFEEYRQKVVPVIEKFGGRYLVRGGELRRLEGNLPLSRLVILEFPTIDAAQKFYDSAEYAPILKLRLDVGSRAGRRLFGLGPACRKEFNPAVLASAEQVREASGKCPRRGERLCCS
jgi:uncharacterized protein (DUF1330 family)